MTKVISPNDIIPSSYNSGWGENKSTILADPARFMDSSSWDGEADFTASIGDTSITEDTEGPFKNRRVIHMKETMLTAMQMQIDGKIAMHTANIEIYLNNPVGIGEHSSVMESLEHQMNELAKWEGIASVMQKFWLKE